MKDTGTPLEADNGRPARTLAELARLAGVSAGTVSRALAGKSNVNPATRDRIAALARHHGFRPNQVASNLRRQRTGTIGIAIPLGHDRRQQISDAFFMTLLGHLADALTEKGYDLMLRRVIPDRDGDWLDRFIGSGMIDGMIVIGQSDQFGLIEKVAADYRAMVVWGHHCEGQRHCVVGSDNRLGGKLAAERLIASGATGLAFLGDRSAIEFAARYDGAEEAAAHAGVPVEAFATHLAPDRIAGEIRAHLDAILRRGINGLFAATDVLAVTCLADLRRRQIAVPRTVRVVGFDDLPLAQHTAPPLTTVRQDIKAGAWAMVDLLLRRMAGVHTESLVMPPQLVVRESA